MGENSEVLSRENRVTGGGKERAGGGSSNMMGNGRNRGNLRKNAKYLAIEKGLKGGSQEKKESRECKVPKTRGLGTYYPSPCPSPFLISYLPADIMKRSQGSARRGGGELRNSLVSPIFTPSFHGNLLLAG